MQAQLAFHTAQKLGFALLSDPDGSVAQKYGTAAPGARFASRRSFVIDQDGVLRHIDTKVDVMQHGSALADWIRAQK